MRHPTHFQPETRRGQNATWGMALGLAIALFVLLFVANQPLGSSLERATLDFWFSLRSPDSNQPSRVSILAIDRKTTRRWRGQNFDSADVRRLLLLLREERVLALALAWPSFSDGALLGGTKNSRRALQRAIASSPSVCVPLRIEDVASIVAPRPNASGYSRDRFAPDFFAALPRPGINVVAGAAAAGHLSFALDDDGRVRRLPLILSSEGSNYPALALATAHLALRAGKSGADGNSLLPGARRLPLLSDGTMLMNFPSKRHNLFSNPRHAPMRSTEAALGETAFRVISVADALDTPSVLRALRGGVVVIGPVDSSSALYATPTGALLPATALHAIALDNILGGNAIERMNPLMSWLLTILLCVTIGGLVASRPPLWSGVAMLLALSGAALLSFGLFQQNIWLDVSPAWVAAGLTFLTGVIGRARRQDRENTHNISTITALSQVSDIMATTPYTGSPDGAQLLRRTLQWAAEVMRVDGAAVLLLDDAKRELRFVETLGPRSETLRGLTVRVGEGIAGWVAQQGEAAIVNDVRRDARFRREYSQLAQVPVRAILCVPLRLSDRMLGVVEVINRADKNPFTSSDAELLLAVANQTALVLENARLYAILNARVTQSESDLESTNRRLESERNTLRTVLQSMSDGVLVSDGEGRVQLINPAASALLPELNDGAIGRNLSELLPDVAAASSVLRDGERREIANQGASTRAGAMRENDARENNGNFGTNQSSAVGTNRSSANRIDDIAEIAAASSQLETDSGATPRDAIASAEIAKPESGVDGSAIRDGTFGMGAAPGGKTQSGPREYSRGDFPRAELLLQRGDADSPQFIEAHSAPLRGSSGALVGVVTVLSDVTEARGIEQAKSDFVSFVAHEMRSPLTSISGFSSMLSRQENQKTPLTASQQQARARFLGIIRNESERLTRLINSLLDVARIEAGRDVELHREAVDFLQVARETVESQRAYSSRHTIELDVREELPKVFADRDKVAQILINLISNALKYSPGGAVRIGARVLADALEISVRDEGPGIAPEQQERLFQRFGRIGTRGAATPNPGPGERAKPTGTGLGLFLTRHFVESHGGTIRVESQTGSGANFIFTLPLWKAQG